MMCDYIPPGNCRLHDINLGVVSVDAYDFQMRLLYRANRYPAGQVDLGSESTGRLCSALSICFLVSEN
jgi:hypothetical protein